jgi:hypothetical protein
MAFRKPEENRSSPSLGYRLSSNRQPGVRIANNRMPSRPMPRFSPEDMPFPNPGQGRPAPMPMPMPGPMEPFRPPPGLGPRGPMMPSPMPMPAPPPGMGPFSPEPFPPMMPRERQGIEQFMPYEDAAVDPSDYRTILKMIEAGLNPDDYMAANRGGIASLMR